MTRKPQGVTMFRAARKGRAGELSSRCKTRCNAGTKHPANIPPNVTGRSRHRLPPVPPVKNDLPPVVLGADLFNGDNDLQAIFWFAPNAPNFFCRHPDERHARSQTKPARRLVFRGLGYPPYLVPSGAFVDAGNCGREKKLAAAFRNRLIRFINRTVTVHFLS